MIYHILEALHVRKPVQIQRILKMSTEIKKVAVVTGANKGIGFGIVRGLCKKYNGIVYLTSRNEERGKKAVEDLKKEGLNALYHQLDITDDASVNNFRDFVKNTYGGFDLLVNNAAIAFSNSATEPVAYQAEHTLKTNYFSLVRICDALFPLLRQNGNVVNVSSSAGHLSRIPGDELRKKLRKDDLTVKELSALMQQFVDDTKDGTHEKNGWGNSTYVVSKVGVSSLTRIQQRLFNNETLNRNISVNSVHPGYVDTDMTNHKGVLTVEEGAKAPLYLSLEPHGLKGQYIWFDSSVVDWLSSEAPSSARTQQTVKTANN